MVKSARLALHDMSTIISREHSFVPWNGLDVAKVLAVLGRQTTVHSFPSRSGIELFTGSPARHQPGTCLMPVKHG